MKQLVDIKAFFVCLLIISVSTVPKNPSFLSQSNLSPHHSILLLQPASALADLVLPHLAQGSSQKQLHSHHLVSVFHLFPSALFLFISSVCSTLSILCTFSFVSDCGASSSCLVSVAAAAELVDGDKIGSSYLGFTPASQSAHCTRCTHGVAQRANFCPSNGKRYTQGASL